MLQYKKRKKQEKIQKIAKKPAFFRPGWGNSAYLSPSMHKNEK